ncbi:hypothetical protein DFH09DRAFT_1145977 [Mycena vulgaris]|nr:hypothetical protein DFH09DRAFT_1145977 [Mycena vulgaris]
MAWQVIGLFVSSELLCRICRTSTFECARLEPARNLSEVRTILRWEMPHVGRRCGLIWGFARKWGEVGCRDVKEKGAK